MRARIGGPCERDVAPGAEKPDGCGGAGDVAPLPAPRDTIARHRDLGVAIGPHHESADTCNCNHRHGASEQRLARLPPSGEDRADDEKSSRQQGPSVLVERVDMGMSISGGSEAARTTDRSGEGTAVIGVPSLGPEGPQITSSPPRLGPLSPNNLSTG